ncbi:glycoside hydrolase family 16 protein [[Candida] arabinofermentans NRRL YB-2248]|uniref:Glycoside hydrolase family 16 protein n=1 Tax=[Candida] arabinofermentans NRRL YB-2248 TaxID=983967 RepID=A0A1E4SW11_9ASCO|nr:glycoside hydrolase family 16 protein [[Candida] arabinofermentans NRRL YB-2248]
MLNPFSSTGNLKDAAVEYDRYPQGLTGSRAVSMQSVGSRSNLINDRRYSSSSSQSDKSSNPFLVDTDFSPFGGYPASSFPLHIDEKEEDDYLHNPDPIADALYEKHRFRNDLKNMDRKSTTALLGCVILAVGLLALFVILPVLTYTGVADGVTISYDSYILLTDYVYPQLSAIRTNLVDTDTPDSALTREAKDGSLWKLVFSDEFNAEGRTFYDGDDQFWYAPDLNYAATKDLEWYDPDAVTTANGTATLRLDAYKNHDLYYRSGALHSWNRMCFTQGVMEVSVRLPNYGNISGLWPGMWSMGNLGRPGYMATTNGIWPYSYDSCDAGITANQSSPDGISYLPGQRLNSCTCEGEDHPNRGTGRGAPEIDIVEGEVDTNIRCGVASQSLQIAPFDIWYMPDYNFVEIHNLSVTSMNTYAGGPYQQAISATTTLNTTWYERGSDGLHHFQKYAYEYLNDDDDGYCRWFVGDDPSFTVYANALGPNGNVGARRLSKEPMSMILNLAISNNWAYIDWLSIDFPSIMSIDYVRIYQPNDSVSLTCDPEDYPTYDYIQDHLNAYEDYNLTTWELAGYTFPKNSLTGC